MLQALSKVQLMLGNSPGQEDSDEELRTYALEHIAASRKTWFHTVGWLSSDGSGTTFLHSNRNVEYSVRDSTDANVCFTIGGRARFAGARSNVIVRNSVAFHALLWSPVHRSSIVGAISPLAIARSLEPPGSSGPTG